MRYMRLLPAVALALGLSIVAAPTAAQATKHPGKHHVGLPTCPETSRVCPPDLPGYAQVYSWARATTGTESDQLFDGTSLPSGWFVQSAGTPGGCSTGCKDTWSTSKTIVGGGVVAMATTCTLSGCLSGGIGQSSANGTTSYGTATAVEARVTGAATNGSYETDNVLQMSQYCSSCTWPPELDYMENGTGNADSYNAFLHCWSGPNQQPGDPDHNGENQQTGDIDNDGDEDQIAQQRTVVPAYNVGAWTTYEVDWYPTQILIYATQSGVTHLETNWLKSTTTNVAGYHNTACNSYWPPSPHAALNLFAQSQIIGSSNPASGSYGLEVDWIAQKSLG
jgi:hypothetical protein